MEYWTGVATGPNLVFIFLDISFIVSLRLKKRDYYIESLGKNRIVCTTSDILPAYS